MPDAWKIAPVLVGAGLETKALMICATILPRNAFGDAVRWIALRMTLKTLLRRRGTIHRANRESGRSRAFHRATGAGGSRGYRRA